MPKKLIEFDHNNNGGRWWLKDEDWKKLEVAGWTVKWYKDDEYQTQFSETKKTGRFLGALASRAEKVFEGCDPLQMAKDEVEELTGQWMDSEGCGYCGKPFCFDESEIKEVNTMCV